MVLKSFLHPGRTGATSSHRISYCFFTMFLLGLPFAQGQKERLYVNITDINLLVDQTFLFQVIQEGEFNTSLAVAAQIQHPDIVQFIPPIIDIPGSDEPNATVILTHDVCAYGKSPGHSEVTFNVTPSGIVNLQSVFLRVTVMHSQHIYIISYIMGWIYFVAWSISFYLQIYINFKRKSVVGLNFDFLALNIMGFTMYSLFNCGLYFSEVIQGQYFSRHPRSHNPIQLNDVFFSLHACFATLVTITQCFIYEREDQRVSNVGRSILGAFTGVVIVTASLGAANKIEWLDFLYYCSYIKLCITLIKYVPQAYMNYKRKSTVGWSIGNIFLDFTGGFLSILQMTLNAYNYNDWISFFGDATKFGLGAFSLAFDIFFMLQHYVFYRYPQSTSARSKFPPSSQKLHHPEMSKPQQSKSKYYLQADSLEYRRPDLGYEGSVLAQKRSVLEHKRFGSRPILGHRKSVRIKCKVAFGITARHLRQLSTTQFRKVKRQTNYILLPGTTHNSDEPHDGQYEGSVLQEDGTNESYQGSPT